MFWDDWYKQLESLALDAPEWKELPAFLERAGQLAAQRESELRKPIQQALEGLMAERRVDLEWLEISTDGWSADRCKACADCCEQIRGLHGLLDTHRETRERKVTSRSADLDRRRQLDDLEIRIIGQSASVASCFAEAGRSAAGSVEPATVSESDDDDTGAESNDEPVVVDPGDVDPGDADPGDADPGDADTSDTFPSDESSGKRPKGRGKVRGKGRSKDRGTARSIVRDVIASPVNRKAYLQEVVELPAALVEDLERESSGQFTLDFRPLPLELTEEDLAAASGGDPNREPKGPVDEPLSAKAGAFDETEAVGEKAVPDTEAAQGDGPTATAEARSVVDIAVRPADATADPAIESPAGSASRFENVPDNEDEREDVTEDENAPEYKPRSETESEPQPEAATVPRSSVRSTDEPVDLLWRLLSSWDLAGAYWLSRSVESTRDAWPVPSWLFAAAHGAMWGPERSGMVADELLGITTTCELPDCPAASLLAVATAWRCTLVEPRTNMITWLVQSLPWPTLRRANEMIRELAKHGHALRPEHIGNSSDKTRIEADIEEVTARAASWLAAATNHHTKLGRANHVWRTLAGQSGELRQLLALVAADRRDRVEEVANALLDWNRGESITRINALDVNLHGRGVHPITSSPLEQLLTWILEARDLGAAWCDHIRQLQRLEGGTTWIDDQISQFGTQLLALYPDLMAELDTLAAGDSPGIAATVPFARLMIGRIAGLFEDVPDSHGGPGRFTLDFGGHASIESALTPRLWWLPEIELNDDGFPEATALPQIACALRASTAGPVFAPEAIAKRMERQDFRFTHSMVAMLDDVDNATWSLWHERHKAELEDARHNLKVSSDRVRLAIEQAASDGVILDDHRASFLGILAKIMPHEAEHFGPLYEQFARIERQLEKRRGARLGEQRQTWEASREKLLELADETTQARIHDFILEKLVGGDTRVVDECLSKLAEAKDDSEPPDIQWFVGEDHRRDYLAEFAAFAERIRQRRVDFSRGRIREVLGTAGVAVEQLPQPRLYEVEKAFDAWRSLKRSSDSAPSPALERPVMRILNYLGFGDVASGKGVSYREGRNAWAHFDARMTASGLSPVPQFGSQRNERYDVVCIWTRPGAHRLAARLQEMNLANEPTIVLYMDQLKPDERLDLARHCRKENLQIIVLDETLMAFLGGEQDVRLPACLAVALANSAVNPYAPRGEVPPEMFVGRRAMRQALLDFSGNGSSVVFGGRQLGKSALLGAVQREFQGKGRVAVCIEIRDVGDAKAGMDADQVWVRMRDALNEAGVFGSELRAERPIRVAKLIAQALKRQEDLRILMLLDEADSFLNQDSALNFKHVGDLKKLMLKFPGRFKVVFAGLHDVQRFEGFPNQPFAHLGSPQTVGPLKAMAARELVTRPLEAVGYRFADDALVLRILSYTNYHAGLIQAFCSNLLAELNRRAPIRQTPPYTISAEIVQAVYSSKNVEREIRNRFDITLGLDDRYRVIVYTMIFEQYDSRESFARLFTPPDVLRGVRQFWRDGFVEDTHETIRGLLNELCGLGVLVRSEFGFRLRSPNLVHLVGNQDEILTRLAELSARPAPGLVFKADRYRQPLDKKGHRYSPLTYAQQRSLAAEGVGVGLIFGSPALGLTDVQPVLEDFVPGESDEGGVRGKFAIIDAKIRQAGQLERWLENFRKSHEQFLRTVVALHVPPDVDLLPKLVRAAVGFRNQRGNVRNYSMRVLLIFDPASTWAWHQVSRQEREHWESQVDTATLFRWEREAIRVRLAKKDKLDTGQVPALLEEATGGWPFLLDTLFDRTKDDLDPSHHARQLQQDLAGQSQLLDAFGEALGYSVASSAVKVLEVFRSVENLECEFMPEFAREVDMNDQVFLNTVSFLDRLQILDKREDAYHLEKVAAQAVERS